MSHRISRRQVIGGAAALAALPSASFAQARQKLVWVVSSATFELGTATQTSIPYAAGFFDEEGLDVELKSARGSALGAQLVITGQADVVHAGTSVGLMVPASKGSPLVAFYNMITQNFQMPAVPAESPVKTLADLKGKKLGVIGQATATVPIVKAVLEDAGVDPNSVTFVDVGYGAQAATALWNTKQVDALAMYDSVYAAIENVNPERYKLRILTSPLSERISFQTALVAKPETIKNKRDALIRLGRAHAKSTLFALENPDAAVRIHYKRYPEQRPSNVDDATALALGRKNLQARLNHMRIDNMAVKRDKWGFMHEVDVNTYLNMLKKIGDVDKGLEAKTIYTNELIDEINKFDVAEVRRKAREFKG
ncbi:MAG TPA: ABC transporter substrate-binding protein [Ramlibacter sp.]|nr:ABC transporter substrate-binding protein [Ramlibacter sp.]